MAFHQASVSLKMLNLPTKNDSCHEEIYDLSLDFGVQKPKQVGNDCSHETGRADLPSCACGNLRKQQHSIWWNL
jgi:hypothetical protein